MKNFLNRIKQITVLVLTLSFVGCTDDANILPRTVAAFTYTVNQDTGTVTFLNTSSNSDEFTWDFGDGTTSSLIDPIKTYPSGTYTVVLEASNISGSSSTFEDVIVINIPEIISFPITFDNPLVNYDATTVFGGASFTVVENPDPSGANASTTNVGEITNSGATFEGVYFDLGSNLDLATDNTVGMKFWSTSPIDVLLKLEEGTGADAEVAVTHGGTGWEDIYFSFSSSSSYSRLTLFVDGPGTSSGAFYLDDIIQLNAADIPCTETELSLPTDFDCEGIAYTDKIVGNVSFTVVDNPELSGVNDVDTKVGQITNTGAAFENAFFNLDVPVDFADENTITLKLYSTQALPVLLKFEDGTQGNAEVTSNHTGSGWEELTFEFTTTGSYNDMVIFVDGPGTTAGTFYVDDIVQGSGNVGPDCVPETTESIAAADLNITFQTNTPAIIEDNTAFSWIDNPDTAGPVNTSCKVGEVVRFNNSPFDNIQIDLANKLDFNASEGIKMKVWSPIANAPVLLKLEEIGNSGNFVEIAQNTGAANTWTELTFDFAPTATPQFNKLVIFFNFNVADGSTYYFDDLMVYGDGGGGGGNCVPESSESIAATDLNITFQTNTPAIFEDNTTFSWIDNPDFAGPVNTSCKVGEVVRANNSPFDNIQIDLTDKLDFNASEGIKMKVWSPIANAPVLLKLEEIGNSGNFVEIAQNTGAANTWTELTYDFDATATPQFDKLVIFFNFNVADGSTYYFDDLMVYGTPGGGGGGGGGDCPAPPAGEFIADGGFEANAGCWALFDNGGSVSISTTVSNGGSNSGQITSAQGANPGLKQERFGVGVIQPNTTYNVQFDIKADSADPLANGAILNAFMFSEPADGSTDPAVQHVLVQADGAVATSWQTRSYTFTTAGNVDGGVSILIELVCGGVAGCGGTINIDNVSMTAQ